MRILHIVEHLRELGNGGVNVAVDLACLQANSGYDVAIASRSGEYEALLKRYGVQCFSLEQSKRLKEFIAGTRQYQDIVYNFKPDIVHTHTMIGASMAKLLKLFSKEAHYHLVATVHNEFQRSSVLMGLADRVIAVSTSVERSMNRKGIPKYKLRTIFNGTIDSPRTRPLASYEALPLHRPAITSVAGMHLRKGLIELVQAFAQIAEKFPEAHLYLVGNGPDRSLIEIEAKKHSVANRIHFEGFQSEPQRYLLATDIFVLASHREPFGLAISEAREAGCAIIASDVDGIPDVLESGRAGILVPPVDSKVLAETLLKLLNDPLLLHHWKTEAQQNIHWLSVKRVHQETLSVYHELHPRLEDLTAR